MRVALCITLALAMVILAASPAAADGRNYRFYGNTRYEVLEAKDIYIYSADVIVRKGALEKAYFFSAGPDGEIFPLTVLNLKKAFPDNHAFHDLLDMAFTNDAGLTKFDAFHKMFKVNRLWLASRG